MKKERIHTRVYNDEEETVYLHSMCVILKKEEEKKSKRLTLNIKIENGMCATATYTHITNLIIYYYISGECNLCARVCVWYMRM